MDQDKKRKLTCTMCGKVVDLYCRITFSQGDRVCLDCKEITMESDKLAFDRYMDNKLYR